MTGPLDLPVAPASRRNSWASDAVRPRRRIDARTLVDFRPAVLLTMSWGLNGTKAPFSSQNRRAWCSTLPTRNWPPALPQHRPALADQVIAGVSSIVPPPMGGRHTCRHA
jgi:hypothetical protein